MKKKILITGGAGFIGSHLADELIHHGYEVWVLDNLDTQVHQSQKNRPAYLHSQAELIVGDIRDREAVERALENIYAVFHFASKVGVGQSMYEIREYTDVNNKGTAVLLEAIIKHPIQKLIVASSMSIYGEGLYKDARGHLIHQSERSLDQLINHRWNLHDFENREYIPLPTPEDKQPNLSSIYALSKYDQECLCLITGKAYKIPVVSLRFFNVYGTRQSLFNPYTGVLAIFASRILNNNPPLIFEDGLQRRDFIHVSDVARACRLSLEKNTANGDIFNIGSGKQYTIKQIALQLSKILGKDIIPDITHKYRIGDIRHCFADIRKAKSILEFEPAVEFEKGLEELAFWLKDQTCLDKVNHATEELASRGLTI